MRPRVAGPTCAISNRRAGGVQGGSAGARSARTLDAAEHRFTLARRRAFHSFPRSRNTRSALSREPGRYNPNSWARDRWISADLKHSQPLSSVAHLKSGLYADVYQYDQHVNSSAAEDCAEGQLNGCVRDVPGVARWVGLEEQLNFDWTHDNRFSTLVGVLQIARTTECLRPHRMHHNSFSFALR